MDEREALVQNIKKYCEMRHITLYKFSRELDISETSLRNIVSGRTDPRLSTIQLVCEHMGQSVSEVLKISRNDDNFLYKNILVLSQEKKKLLCLILELLSNT